MRGSKKMKKYLAILVTVVLAVGLLSMGCGEDDGTCTSSDADRCRNERADCAMGTTSQEEIDACADAFCDCLDDLGCDDYLDEANC
jgi:hypothetical protein